MPDLGNELSDTTLYLLPAEIPQHGTVQCRQTVAQRTVLVNECAASDLRRVRGEHQIDVKIGNRFLNVSVFGLGLQHAERSLEHRAGREVGFGPHRHGVLLVSDVGQIQKLAERSCNHEHLVVIKRGQQLIQRLPGIAVLRFLGLHPNLLYAFKERLPGILFDDIAQYVAQ